MAPYNATSRDTSSTQQDATAPWLPIPSRAISVVEHPCIVKNIHKAVASLGGPGKLSKGLRIKLEPQTTETGDSELPSVLSVSLRPDDPFAKHLLAAPVTTNNLLLRVTVPKRTGRKRKRGSSGPFEPAECNDGQSSTNVHVSAPTIFRSLKDNAASYKIAVVGLIDETHRFRDLPDIQYAATTNSTMNKVKDHILPLSFSKLKSLDVKSSSGPDLDRDVGPGAEFIQTTVAYNYRFQQAQNVKIVEGQDREVSKARGPTAAGYTIISPTAERVPTGPKPGLIPENDLTPYIQALIDKIRRELVQRRIITRHRLYNTLGWDKRDKLRQAAVYCGYFFETGPWREALIDWGLDPRGDPEFRFHQTVSFLSYKKGGTARHFAHFDRHIQILAQMDPNELRDQHMFDGVNVSQTGNLFQFLDITDPLIQRILRTENIRTTCSPTAQGWFHVGTWAKATVILKDKMNTILRGETPDNSLYSRVLAWPELWDDQEIYAPYKAEFYDKQMQKEKAREHNIMRSVRWAARNPRYAFEKMEALGVQAPGAVGNDDEPEDEEVPEDLTEYRETAEDILEEAEVLSDEDEDDLDDEDDDESDDSDEELEGEREPEHGDDDDDEMDDVDGEWETDEDQPTKPEAFAGLFRR